MSVVAAMPPVKPGDNLAPSTSATAVEFHYTQTDSFVALLQQLRASLLVSTYQANKLLSPGPHPSLTLPPNHVELSFS